MSSTTSASEDFRSVVLRGRNVASFKFALAKSVLSLAESGATTASLDELAVPFSQELCAHIKEVDTQSTSASSRFLDACRHFNAGAITREELVTTTALLASRTSLMRSTLWALATLKPGSFTTSASRLCAESG